MCKLFFVFALFVFSMQKLANADQVVSPDNLSSSSAQPSQDTMFIPFIGNVPLAVAGEKNAGVEGLGGSSIINLGSLSFPLPVVTVSENNERLLETDATFLGKKARLRSKEFALDGSSSYNLELLEDLWIPISPWKKILLKNMSLYLGLETKKLSTELSVFSANNEPDCIVSYLFKNEELSKKSTLEQEENGGDVFQIAFTNVLLNSFIPYLAPAVFKNVLFEKLVCTIQNSFTEPVITMEASLQTADLKSGVPILMEKAPIQFKGSYNKIDGFYLTGILALDIPLIPKSVVLSRVEFAIKHRPELAEAVSDSSKIAAKMVTDFSMQSSVSIKIPGMNELECIVSGELLNDSIDLLEGTILIPVVFQGITLNGAKVRIKPKTSHIEIIGMATVMGTVAVDAGISIERVGESPHPVVSFSAKATKENGLKPFKDIPGIHDIPGMKDLSLNNIEFSLNSDKVLEVSGECRVFDTLSKARVVKTLEGTVLFATPLQNLKIASVLPNLKKTPFSSLTFPSPQFVVTSFDYFDPKTMLMYKKGFSLSSVMDSSCSFLANVHKLIPSLPTALDFACSANPGSTDVNFSIALPSVSAIKFGAHSSLQGLSLFVKGKPFGPSISIKGRMLTMLPMQKHSSIFSSECEFDVLPGAVGLILKGTMLGDWDNVFTIPGITLSNVAIELGATFLPAPPFVAPKQAGFAGSLAIGNKKLTMGTKISTDGDYLLYGALDGALNIKDLVWLANKMGAKLPGGKIPKELAEIKNVVGKIATKDTTVGDIYFSQGVTFRGLITLFNQNAMVDFNVDMYGIAAAGSLPPIVIGKILKLSGDGIDGKKGSNEGVAFRVALTPTEQCIYFSGFAEIFKIMSATDVIISPQELFLKTRLRLFGLVDVMITGVGTKIDKHDDFLMKGEYENGIDLNLSKDDLRGAVEYLSDEISQSKSRFDDKLKDLDSKILDRERLLKKINATYRNGVEATTVAQKRVDEAEDKVKKLDRRIKEISNRLGVCNERYAPLFLQTNDMLLTINSYNKVSLMERCNEEAPDGVSQVLSENNSGESSILLASVLGDIGHSFKKTGHSMNRAFDSAGRSVSGAYNEVKEGVGGAVDFVQELGSEAVNETKAGINKALEDAKIIGNDALKFVEDQAKWGDLAELAALKVAREVAVAALEAASGVLVVAKETCKHADHEILALRLQQAQCAAEFAAETAGLETARGIVKGAVASYPAVTWLTKIHIKKVAVSGSMRNPFPKIRCDVRAFNKFDGTIELNCNPIHTGKELIKKCYSFLKGLS